MRKIVGLASLVLLLVGMLVTAGHARPTETCGDAGTVVDASCLNPDHSAGQSESCELWVKPGTGSPVDGCSNPV